MLPPWMIAILCAIERPNPVLMIASFCNSVERFKNGSELFWHAIAVVGDKNSRRIRAVTHKIQ
jgi:hypothetical protein